MLTVVSMIASITFVTGQRSEIGQYRKVLAGFRDGDDNR